MLPSRARLRGKRAIERVQRSRQIFRSPLFTLRVARREDHRGPRVAVAVGKLTSKRAVDRNRVARWLREALRETIPHLGDNLDLRLSTSAPAERYSFPQCVQGVQELLGRASLLQGKHVTLPTQPTR